MAMTVTREYIRDAARALADAPAAGHSGDDVVNVFINQSLKWLWTDMVLGDPDRHAVTASITTVAGTLEYELEDDFFEIRGVDLVQGNDRIRIERYEWGERNRGRGGFNPFMPSGANVRYRVMGGGQDGSGTRIVFDGDPGASTYEVRYIPVPPTLSADDDEIDGVAGWEDVVIYDVAGKIHKRAQENEEAAMCWAQRDQLKAALRTLATTRDVGSAPRIADTRSNGAYFTR